MQIPFVEFMPSLMVKFRCCTTNLVRHFDLDRHIISLTNMKCSSIQFKSKSSDFHYFFKGIKYDNCLKCFLEKNKNKMPNDLIYYLKLVKVILKYIHFLMMKAIYYSANIVLFLEVQKK